MNLTAGYGAKALMILFAAMAKHPVIKNCDAEAGPGGAHLKTPREMALLMMGPHLKRSQFEYLFKKRFFLGGKFFTGCDFRLPEIRKENAHDRLPQGAFPRGLRRPIPRVHS